MSGLQKTILGTVQLGLNYGINNRVGRPSLEVSHSILQYCLDSGITNLDTANAYGESLQVIGQFAGKNNFKIHSKFVLSSDKSASGGLEKSLATLKLDSIEGFSFHLFDDLISVEKKELIELKENGKVKKLGVSLYSVEQFEKALDYSYIDLIQLPFNLLDSSAEKINLCKRAKDLGKEIHVRSIFLQGLFSMNSNTIPMKFDKVKDALQCLETFCKEGDWSLLQLALAYPYQFDFIDGVVIGMETLDQAKENISLIQNQRKIDAKLLKKIQSIKVDDVTMLNPSNWGRL